MKLSGPMNTLLMVFASQTNGTIDAWNMKNVALPKVREMGEKATAQTVKSLESRGVIESRVRDNDGTSGSLTEWSLTPYGHSLAAELFPAQVKTTRAVKDTQDAVDEAAAHGVTLDMMMITASGEAVQVSRIDRFGIALDNGRTFLAAADLITWAIGDLDRRIVMDFVTMENATLAAGIAYAVRLRAEVEHASRVERIVNDATAARIAEDIHAMPAPFRTSGKVKSTAKSRRYRKG